MRQYFTYRPLVLNGIYTPQYAFDNELNTIDWLLYSFVCQKEWDNRHLAYFDYVWELTNEKIIEIVSNALIKYSYHYKTIETAKEYIIECIPNIETIEIVWDEIIFTTEMSL